MISRLAPGTRRALWHGLIGAGLLFFGYIFFYTALQRPADFGYDAYAYWHLDIADPYSQPLGSHGFFAYSPAFAVAVYPLTFLPWPAFIAAWWGLLFAAIAYLGRRDTLVLLAFPFVALELFEGNIHVLLAAAIVLGFRYPAAWAFVLLTKTTAGVGLLWFAVRGEWRNLAIALAATAAVTALTFFVVPDLWFRWIALLLANAGQQIAFPALPVPLWLRLPAAALVVIWGARRGAAWTVPLAATIALPVLWIASLSMLIGCWPLLRRDSAARYHAADAPRSKEESLAGQLRVPAGQLAPADVDRATGVQRGVTDRARA